MVSKKIAVMVMIVLMVVLFDRSSMAIDLCGMTDSELTECRPAVSKGSTTNPTDVCCKALEHADFDCLCGYKNSPWLGSFGVDPKLASGLPKECGVANAPTC